MTLIHQSDTPRHGPQVVLFCGGRDCTAYSHWDMVHADMFGLPKGSVIVHGNYDGLDKLADKIARRLAREREFHVAPVDAFWDIWGRGAGPRRNSAMMLLRPDFAFAYPTGGPGTAGMLKLLRAANVSHFIREAVAS